MMNKLTNFLYFLTLFSLPLLAHSQDKGSPPPSPYRPTPAHMWELGLHGGTAMSFGDVKLTPSIGGGFHLRRALDYVFSIRADGFYGKLRQEDDVNGISESTIQSGSLQLLVSLNNLIWNNIARRKTNFYTFGGVGLTRFEVEAVQKISADLKAVDPTVQSHLEGGVGIAFRLSNRFNIGFEGKVLALFGKDADLLDGVARRNKDALGYGSVRLNFNLGNSNSKSEPLYWVNPMDIIMQDITELKNRPVLDLTDSDADGVIDALDQDNTTPAGVVVDTRGLPLDSDGDGVANYQDDEPYVPQNMGGNPTIRNEEDVRRIVQEELKNVTNGKGRIPIASDAITDWFLPTVHFNIDSYKIRYADYGSLASVAHVLKSNPELKVVVTGFTDKTASDQYNFDLSYRRAKAVIEHLVNVHGIARSRLLLNYNGEDSPLVPSTGSTLMNRRAEFRVATDDDVEMENPVPVTKKESRKSGF